MANDFSTKKSSFEFLQKEYKFIDGVPNGLINKIDNADNKKVYNALIIKVLLKVILNLSRKKKCSNCDLIRNIKRNNFHH